jgi:putative inorganic carbon (HCO3(-)) transporter
MFVYSARPEDWIIGLSHVPLAKITVIASLLALAFSIQHLRRRLPREVVCLALLTTQMFLASILSPIWRRGAVMTTVDFVKILIIVVVIVISVSTLRRLRLLMSVQAGSIAVIAVVSVLKNHLLAGRLSGVLGGDYANPNELALVIVISLPVCLALLFLSKSLVRRGFWTVAMAAMIYGVFATGSRAGFLSLIVMVGFCLWDFAIRGRRRYLLICAALGAVILWQGSGRLMSDRFEAIYTFNPNAAGAYSSAQQRLQLFWRSVEATETHPLFGVGPGNFQIISGNWHVSHNSLVQASSEGGLPGLFLYVLIVWFGFKNVRTTKRMTRLQDASNVLARALTASLAAYVVGAQFDNTAYLPFPYFLVAYTIVLLSIAKRPVVSPAQHDPIRQVAADTSIYSGKTRPMTSAV